MATLFIKSSLLLNAPKVVLKVSGNEMLIICVQIVMRPAQLVTQVQLTVIPAKILLGMSTIIWEQPAMRLVLTDIMDLILTTCA